MLWLASVLYLSGVIEKLNARNRSLESSLERISECFEGLNTRLREEEVRIIIANSEKI